MFDEKTEADEINEKLMNLGFDCYVNQYGKKYVVIIKGKTKLSEDMRLVNPIYLAKMFHDVYEKISKKEGWVTQKSTQVEFHELPKANQRTMVRTCHEIMKQFYVIPRDK